MPFLPTTLILLVVSLLHSALAQDDGSPHVDGASNSKVAVTGAIIGGVLVVIALLAVAVYGIERWMSRRRAKTARFAPLPTFSEAEEAPYRYLSLPPATRPAKSYGHGPFYPGSALSPPASPNARTTSEYGGASPTRSPGAQSVRFDTYGHGPFYPGPEAQVSSPRVSPLPSPMTPSFRQSQGTTLVSSPETSTPASPFSLRNDQPKTLWRATSTPLAASDSVRR